MTNLRLGYGPFLLLLYQAAPVHVQQDSLGRFRVSAGFATGQWENDEYSCDGQLLSATPVRHHSAGVQLDVWPHDRVRVTVFGGTARQSPSGTISNDQQYSSVEPIAGPFGGAQFAFEGQKFGIGFGVTRISAIESPAPSLYLRAGNMDEKHFRMDLFTPNPVFPSAAWGRLGIGVNSGHLRKAGGFIGLGLGPPDYNSKMALLGELRIPVGRHLMAQFHGLAGGGEQHSQWSVGTGLQLDFGSRR